MTAGSAQPESDEKRPEQLLGPLSCLLELSTRELRIGC